MKNLEIKDHQEWHGTYKNVPFRIVKWRYSQSMDYRWNYYLFVKPRKIRTQKSYRGVGRQVDYYKMYSDVELQGGITYWGKHIGSQLEESHEVGCDYGHIWNDREYSLEDIKRDVKNSIDTLPKDLFFN
jgi:hypothetical protein